MDSWAWVEYLRGSERGQRVKEEIAREADVLTHVVTVAEIISKFKREGIDIERAWKALTTLSRIVEANEIDAKNAGLLHASMKQKRPNFSLADAFILQVAKRLGGKVLTGDPDFRSISEAVMLK